jgi:hypothetical protein
MNYFYKNLLIFLFCATYFFPSLCPENLSEKFHEVIKAVDSNNWKQFNEGFKQGDENIWFHNETLQKCDQTELNKTSLLHLACQRTKIDKKIFSKLVMSSLIDTSILVRLQGIDETLFLEMPQRSDEIRSFSPLCLAVIAKNEQAVKKLCESKYIGWGWGMAWKLALEELEKILQKSRPENSVAIQERKKLKRIMVTLKKKNAYSINYKFISPLLWGFKAAANDRCFIKEFYDPLKGISASSLSKPHKIATLQRSLLDPGIEGRIKELQEIARQKVKKPECIGGYDEKIVSHYPCNKDKAHNGGCFTNDPFFKKNDTTFYISIHNLLMSSTFDVRKFMTREEWLKRAKEGEEAFLNWQLSWLRKGESVVIPGGGSKLIITRYDDNEI